MKNAISIPITMMDICSMLLFLMPSVTPLILLLIELSYTMTVIIQLVFATGVKYR